MKTDAVVLIVATMDTKGEEALYLKSCFDKFQQPVLIMDAGIRGESPVKVDVTREQVAESGGNTLAAVRDMGHESKSLEAMIAGAKEIAIRLVGEGKVGGIIGMGGSMGTTLGTAVMRIFPVGFPKVMISTMASRDTRAFVGTKDIFMLHSVCDLVGINRMTSRILHNGAAAMCGMLQNAPQMEVASNPLVFLSTLGTTEACAQAIRKSLERAGREVVIFHTVGAGGEALEESLKQEDVKALVDLSLHEMADHRFGGDYDAGPLRGAVALQRKIPTVLVPGNIDFLVTGPLKDAQKKFPGRPYHQHNAAITVVRSTAGEMALLAEEIAGRVNDADGATAILIPMEGFSAFDSEKGPLPDSGARQKFARTLQNNLVDPAGLQVLPHHINDPEFSRAVLRALDTILATQQ